VADNLSPLQRLAVECFEDARIDHLVLRRFPGLAPVLLALHPMPDEDACDPVRESCLRHRLACCRARCSTRRTATATAPARIRRALSRSCCSAATSSTAAWPAWLWSGLPARAARATSRPGALHRHRGRLARRQPAPVDLHRGRRRGRHHTRPHARACPRRRRPAAAPLPGMGRRPRRPTAPTGSASTTRCNQRQPADVEALLQRHAAEARHLKRLLDLLKPQDRTRCATRSRAASSTWTWRCAPGRLARRRPARPAHPDEHTAPTAASIAVLLLVDLSQSVNDEVPGSGQTRADPQPARPWPCWPGPSAPGRRVGHRRLSLQHPARGALPAHQGLCRSLGRGPKAPAGGLQACLLHPHGRGACATPPLLWGPRRPTRSCCWC
jgi:nitric oxide reductase NorD protein